MAQPTAGQVRQRLRVMLDYVVALLFAVIIFGVLFRNSGFYRFPITAWYAPNWVPPLLAICLCVPAALRRRGPLRALAAVIVFSIVTIALGGEITRGAFLPMAYVLYLVATTSERRASVGGLAAAVGLLAGQGFLLHLKGVGAGNATGAILVMAICWTVGQTVRQRRAYAANLRFQAASTAVTQERLRIARELHDVVAHSMTVVAVQAGFGEYIFDSQPAEARAALAAIQTVSREALSDMQRLLGVLRQAASQGDDQRSAGAPGQAGLPGQGGAGNVAASGAGHDAGPARSNGHGQAPLTPAPGLADLDRLAARTAGAGVRVGVERTGRPRDLPPGIDLSAYRIVQEALTNVVKHSGAGSCQVAISYGTDDLLVVITDPGPGAGRAGAGLPAGAGVGRADTPAIRTGHGLIGMRERVSLCGGEFSAGPLPGQGFKVAARLPLAAGPP
jgi:signal transduction histidine kinase